MVATVQQTFATNQVTTLHVRILCRTKGCALCASSLLVQPSMMRTTDYGWRLWLFWMRKAFLLTSSMASRPGCNNDAVRAATSWLVAVALLHCLRCPQQRRRSAGMIQYRKSGM